MERIAYGPAGSGAADACAALEWLSLGGIRIPVDECAQALVPYRGPRGSFPYVSASDVLSGDADPASLIWGIIGVNLAAWKYANLSFPLSGGLLAVVALFLSVLFSDVRDFTAISEGLTPGELSRLMNEYLSPTLDQVSAWAGRPRRNFFPVRIKRGLENENAPRGAARSSGIGVASDSRLPGLNCWRRKTPF